jgi:hypothetical protein
VWRSHPQKLDEEDDAGDPLDPPMLWPDGRHIASNGLGRIFLWEIESGECTQVLQTEAICRDGDPYFKLGCERDLGRVIEARARGDCRCRLPREAVLNHSAAPDHRDSSTEK